MENINIKVILDKVFGKSCDSITCDTCKYKEDCTLINKFSNDIKDKGLSPDQYFRGLVLFAYVLKEQKYINDFGKTQEDIIKLVTKDGFELDWLINLLIIINRRISLRMLVMMKFMLNLNVEKQINLLNNPT